MSLHYLVKLKMLILRVLSLSITERCSFHLICGCEFTRFESIWLQRVWTIAREGVQNTHHWSEQTKITTLRTEWTEMDHIWIISLLRQPFIHEWRRR